MTTTLTPLAAARAAEDRLAAAYEATARQIDRLAEGRLDAARQALNDALLRLRDRVKAAESFLDVIGTLAADEMNASADRLVADLDEVDDMSPDDWDAFARASREAPYHYAPLAAEPPHAETQTEVPTDCEVDSGPSAAPPPDGDRDEIAPGDHHYYGPPPDLHPPGLNGQALRGMFDDPPAGPPPAKPKPPGSRRKKGRGRP